MAGRSRSIVLCLIRCGDTAWAGEKRLQGATDLPLSEGGRAEVTAERGRLGRTGLASIHHPPDEAALETARLLAGVSKAKLRVNAALSDPALGLLEGLTEQEFADRFPKRYRQWQDDPLSMTPREGEAVVEARARIFSAVARILKRSRQDEVGIVLHQVGAGLLRCWLAEAPAGTIWTLLRTRPLVERYVMAEDVVNRLQKAGRLEVSRS